MSAPTPSPVPNPGSPFEAETLPPAAPPSEKPTLAPSATPVPPAPAGIQVPGYELLAELGRGGMGVVYQARQARLGRLVALKMILAGAHAGEAELARFRTEAEVIARLQHPNIVSVHEVGEADGCPYFSLEYCPGGSLASRLAGAPLPPAEAARLVETLARAVQAAHEAGIVHRDLKPANVLLAADGTPKITDFGLAKKLGDGAGQTASGAVLGTPAYMAPEQAGRGKDVGPAADVYALGAILYECLTGRPPFRAATFLDTLVQVASEEPVPPRRLEPKVPADLETICLKCLRKEPAKRYGSAADLADDLHRYRDGRPIRGRRARAGERLLKWARRRPAEAALLLIGVVVAVTLAVALPRAVRDWRLKSEAQARTREAANRLLLGNYLKQLGVALRAYADRNGQRFPPHALYGPEGKPLLSWRVLVLPYLNEEGLFQRFHLDEPWDSPANKPLLAQMPKVFALPGAPAGTADTHYLGFVGKGAFFEGREGLRWPQDFPDGPAQTIMLVEAARGVPWTKPEDLPFDPDPAKSLPPLGATPRPSCTRPSATARSG